MKRLSNAWGHPDGRESLFVSTTRRQMPIVSSYTVAQRRQPNHLGCVRNMPKTCPKRPRARPKHPRTPKKVYRRRRAPRAGATWRICLARPQGPVRTPRSDGTLSAGAPRVGRCFPASSRRLHPDLGAKMENAPRSETAVKRLGDTPTGATTCLFPSQDAKCPS